MSTITRRRSSRDEEEAQERPARRRTRSEEPDDAKTEETSEERPRRRARGERPRGRGSRGWGSFDQKRAKSSSRADEFKPGADNKVVIKFLEDSPFDTYNQHWIEVRDLPAGVKRSSYMCRDDEYFDGEEHERECPLCEIGEQAKTYSLFNVLDLTNPRKAEVKVWSVPPTVASKLKKAGQEKKTQPINREDLYWEVELVKSKNKSEWTLVPVKARDLETDYDPPITPLDTEELETLSGDLHDDRKSVTHVDTYDELDELAESLLD